MRHLLLALLILTLAACGRGVPNGARVVVAGDSVMAWNRIEGASVADGLAERLGVAVGDVSLPAARMTGSRPGPMHIPNQVAGLSPDWPDWMVLNGGANDLRAECGCTGCDDVLDRLISSDGQSGAIPDLVRQVRAQGTRVLWADYYTSPRFAGTACVRPYDRLTARLTRMAAADDGVLLVDMGRVVSSSDRELFAADRLHPSERGSARIAALIADTLQQADTTLR